MATSGSRDFTLDVADIIEEAYERCGLELRTGYEADTARRSLNLMFADWANRGVNLWTVKLGTLSLVSGTATYALSDTIADLLEVVVRRSGTDFEVQRISRGEYQNQPNKTTTGRPSSFYFNRQTTPEINLWPTPENNTDELRYYYVQRIEDADSLVNDVDAPFRFLPCMAAGLAYYLAVKRSPDRVQLLKSIYEEEFQRAADEDEDRVPLKLTPSISYLRV
ncbi:MAG: hypothetical protein CMN45_01855 [SAR116 cluster bacterium]|jgi:hypothetical protein|nr:hypothetical protein [SAR116 cluster bacterium]|tara:strand:- start:916 stop:1581 length:666 start_codon:yes stop_codon:yes gene_type:complete